MELIPLGGYITLAVGILLLIVTLFLAARKTDVGICMFFMKSGLLLLLISLVLFYIASGEPFVQYVGKLPDYYP